MDLSTTYLGLELKNPLIASSSPLTGTLEDLRRLEKAGVSAVVLPSLFEEQLRNEAASFQYLIDSETPQAPVNENRAFPAAAREYLDLIRKARAELDIPVIASLNGITASGWTQYARAIEAAGASALELNIYFVPTDLTLTAFDIEQRYLVILEAIKGLVDIPVSVKLSPYFTSLGAFALELDETGADGLVLFNRFYQPDINIDKRELSRALALSTPAEIRLPLLWLGVLAGKTKASLAASTGVHSGTEIIKYLLAGADVAMTASALLRHGPEYARVMLREATEWLHRQEYSSIADIRGRMRRGATSRPEAFERANYFDLIQGYEDPFAPSESATMPADRSGATSKFSSKRSAG